MFQAMLTDLIVRMFNDLIEGWAPCFKNNKDKQHIGNITNTDFTRFIFNLNLHLI